MYELPRRTGLDCAELFELLDQWFEDLNDDAISPTELQEEMRRLFDDNWQIGFVGKLRDYNLTKHEETMVAFFSQAGSTECGGQDGDSIQNIILQEMEQLDGIMIATTNLTQNLDTAFERRFLYKIKFEKPTEEARAHIWHSMIPDLSEQNVHTLASRYDFSGGQIENIARHYAIDVILHGHSGYIS